MIPPSIFNDVIGPVMRGPSSSHSAAAMRIGWFARALMEGCVDRILVQGDNAGSLPTTYLSQGSEMGLAGGILGFSLSDSRLLHYKEHLEHAGIQLEFKAGDFGDSHPNSYRIFLENSLCTHSIIALSTGGGAIEIIDIDGISVSILGDRYLYLLGGNKDILHTITLSPHLQTLQIALEEDAPFLLLEHDNELDLKALQAENPSLTTIAIPPCMPIVRPWAMELPFENSDELLLYHQTRGNEALDMAELALLYEGARGDLSEDAIIEKMGEVVDILRASIHQGLAGTIYQDRILHHQSGTFQQKRMAGTLHDLGALNTVIAYTTALMEVKSAMGVIVAAPTAGSCGGLPATILGIAEDLDSSKEEIARAFLVAGLIGIFIARDATFSAEIGGCQAECGAGSGMAAAAAAYLLGGTVTECLAAASMALQNILGMICDPVANRVEVPCLGKNIMAASNALSMANIAVAGFDPIISLSEVIHTMDRVGKSIPHALRCTGHGGLSITQASQDIAQKLAQNAL